GIQSGAGRLRGGCASGAATCTRTGRRLSRRSRQACCGTNAESGVPTRRLREGGDRQSSAQQRCCRCAFGQMAVDLSLMLKCTSKYLNRKKMMTGENKLRGVIAVRDSQHAQECP